MDQGGIVDVRQSACTDGNEAAARVVYALSDKKSTSEGKCPMSSRCNQNQARREPSIVVCKKALRPQGGDGAGGHMDRRRGRLSAGVTAGPRKTAGRLRDRLGSQRRRASSRWRAGRRRGRGRDVDPLPGPYDGGAGWPPRALSCHPYHPRLARRCARGGAQCRRQHWDHACPRRAPPS